MLFYVGMKGPLSLAEVLQYLDDHAPDIPERQLEINYATIV